jgi:hypothetical protein
MLDSSLHASWTAKLDAARATMKERAVASSVLIEIAAQHPLVDGVLPNEEFRTRLDRGKELFDAFRASGRAVEVYVPGSRHMFDGQPDLISLSSAGKSYLESLSIPSELIHGEDLNYRYKGTDGVYGSADECFVASQYFKDGLFGTLASVTSPAQMLRKTLHYIAFGVVPQNFTAPTIDSYHDYIDELFLAIPRVLAVDSTLQGDSKDAERLRAERKP